MSVLYSILRFVIQSLLSIGAVLILLIGFVLIVLWDAVTRPRTIGKRFSAWRSDLSAAWRAGEFCDRCDDELWHH